VCPPQCQSCDFTAPIAARSSVTASKRDCLTVSVRHHVRAARPISRNNAARARSPAWLRARAKASRGNADCAITCSAPERARTSRAIRPP
jgi:hypothetical protein